MKRGRILFRADGHQGMGLGHVVRSLALAEMLQDEYDIVFAIRNPLASLKDQIQALDVQLLELPWPTNDLEEARMLCTRHLQQEDIVVLDGYHFTTAYQRLVKAQGCKLVCIDDIHAYPFLADVVINHALGIREEDYEVVPQTLLKLGTKFSLVRKEIRIANRRRPAEPGIGPLLLCCGGADPKNDSLRILKQLVDLGTDIPIHLVLGAAYAYSSELDAYLGKKESGNVLVHKDLSAQALAGLFERCPIAVLPPSTIVYEYLSIGGLLYLEVIAENQMRMFESFVSLGLAKPWSAFRTSTNLNKTQWQMLLQHQASYFDGQQQARFKQIFAELQVTTAV